MTCRMSKQVWFLKVFISELSLVYLILSWTTATETLLLYKYKNGPSQRVLLILKPCCWFYHVLISQNTDLGSAVEKLLLFPLITVVSIFSISGILVIKSRSMHILAHIREEKDFFSCLPLGQSLLKRRMQIPATHTSRRIWDWNTKVASDLTIRWSSGHPTWKRNVERRRVPIGTMSTIWVTDYLLCKEELSR